MWSSGSRGRARGAPQGITLVELLVVLGVVGLLVGMSVPALIGYSKQVRLNAVVRQLVGLASLARSVAISSHADHTLVIDLERQEVRVVNAASGRALDTVLRLPASVAVEVEVGGAPSAQTEIVFRPTGSLQGRTTSIILADPQKQHTITITSATGAISVD